MCVECVDVCAYVAVKSRRVEAQSLCPVMDGRNSNHFSVRNVCEMRRTRLVSATNRAEECRVVFISRFPLIMIPNKREGRRVCLRVSTQLSLCTAVVGATVRTRDKVALFITIVGRVLVSKQRRTRRCVSVDSSFASCSRLARQGASASAR